MKTISNDQLKEEILAITNIPKWKHRKAYIYGSQVYGTAKPYSDTDILLVSSCDVAHKEWKTSNLNIHLYTPDVFASMLFENHILSLECVYSPDEFKIFQDEIPVVAINNVKLIKKTMSLSQNSWHVAKFKINQGDFEKGSKSIFHSIRMLNFATQLIKNGKIQFDALNDLHEQIMNFESVQWNSFKDKFIGLKVKEERELLSCSDLISNPV